MAAIVFFLIFFFLQWMVFKIYLHDLGYHIFPNKAKAQLEELLRFGHWAQVSRFCSPLANKNWYLEAMLLFMHIGADRAQLEQISQKVLDRIPESLVKLRRVNWYRFGFNVLSLGGAVAILYWDGMSSKWVVAPLIVSILISLFYMSRRTMHYLVTLVHTLNAKNHLTWMINKIIQYQVSPQPLPED